MPDTNKIKNLKIRPFSKNRIQKRIYTLAAGGDIKADNLEEKIKKALNISPKQLTYFLENLGNPPDIKQLCIIAQVLDCTVDDLIELKS